MAATPDIVIGTIVSPFGIKGQVKVKIETDFPDRFEELEEVTLRDRNGGLATYGVKDVRFHKGMALVKFLGCDNMTAAEELRGRELVIPESEMVELPEGEYYIHDLIGLHVEGSDGKDLGVILEVIRNRANDAYLTTKTIIPALKTVVREVDIPGRKMVVDLPESDSE